MRLDQVIARYKTLATAGEATPPPSAADIRRAEQALGIALPPSFVRFHREFGGKKPPFWSLIPVLRGERTQQTFDLVRANRLEHDADQAANPLPSHYVTFHGTGTGDQVCFDTSSAQPSGELRVVLWRHDQSREENLSRPLTWPSFVDWLEEELDELDTE